MGIWFFCWLDLNNIWFLGCTTLPARLGWILRPAPRYGGATASSWTRSISKPSCSGLSSRLPRGSGLGFKEKRRGKESGGEEEGGGEKKKKRHLLLITHSCDQAAPISAARSWQPAGNTLGRALRLSPTGSGARETPRRERNSPPSIRRLYVGISIIMFIYSPYQREQPLCLLSPRQQHLHEGN